MSSNNLGSGGLVSTGFSFGNVGVVGGVVSIVVGASGARAGVGGSTTAVSYTHLTLPTNREV